MSFIQSGLYQRFHCIYLQCTYCALNSRQELESWLEESAHREDDVMILTKYSHIDEDKIKALNLCLEQLQETAVKKRRLLGTESTETMAAQVRREGGGELAEFIVRTLKTLDDH